MGHYLVQWALGGGTRFNEALWALGGAMECYGVLGRAMGTRGRY